MRQYNILTITLSFLTLAAYIVGLYGTISLEEGFFLYFGLGVSMYLVIFHPLVFFALGRGILKQADIRDVPESLIFILLIIPFFPISYVLIPLLFELYESVQQASAIEFVFIIFEMAAFGAGIYAFVRYARKTVKDQMVPRDFYAIHHYLIGTLIYFYFVRLTLVSSILVTGVVPG